MSAKHPVIAVTGSSGAGTTTTSLAFRKIFAQLKPARRGGGRR
ncbi:phosphoribulokinase [Klebsiella pneumoniae]|uniref:Phosphoribulokinase n=1 Tax=Klebsiella pneumoniae TaxID=573 RepID=A0A447RWG0_KLEPN|nr:phosphoribulokinase [Klebsiella pneumoniae]